MYMILLVETLIKTLEAKYQYPDNFQLYVSIISESENVLHHSHYTTNAKGTEFTLNSGKTETMWCLNTKIWGMF